MKLRTYVCGEYVLIPAAKADEFVTKLNALLKAVEATTMKGLPVKEFALEMNITMKEDEQ